MDACSGYCYSTDRARHRFLQSESDILPHNQMVMGTSVRWGACPGTSRKQVRHAKVDCRLWLIVVISNRYMKIAILEGFISAWKRVDSRRLIRFTGTGKYGIIDSNISPQRHQDTETLFLFTHRETAMGKKGYPLDENANPLW